MVINRNLMTTVRSQMERGCSRSATLLQKNYSKTVRKKYLTERLLLSQKPIDNVLNKYNQYKK